MIRSHVQLKIQFEVLVPTHSLFKLIAAVGFSDCPPFHLERVEPLDLDLGRTETELLIQAAVRLARPEDLRLVLREEEEPRCSLKPLFPGCPSSLRPLQFFFSLLWF